MGLFDGRRRCVANVKYGLSILCGFLRFSANYRLTAEACFGHVSSAVRKCGYILAAEDADGAGCSIDADSMGGARLSRPNVQPPLEH